MTSNHPPPPILGSLNETCIVTSSLYRTLDNLSRLGLGPFRVFKFNSTTVPRQQLRDKADSDLFEILAAFASPPDDDNQPVLEIMQPVKGQTLMQEYLDAHGNQ
ncbi:hypothetical protein BDV19DRAFT_392914 [Aspergillus venezuelensis]